MKKELMASALALALAGCGDSARITYETPVRYRIEHQEIDQLFRDHNGWRVLYTDGNGELQERRHEQGCGCTASPRRVLPIIKEGELRGLDEHFRPVRIYRNPAVDRAQERTLHATMPGTFGDTYDFEYVEIHLPSAFKVSPGHDSTGGKFPQHPPVMEIR